MAYLRFIIALLLCAVCGGGALAAGPQFERSMLSGGSERPEEQVDFDIDKVVDAAAKAMAAAARNYYLPDKPENAKTIARYAKDARKVIFSDTTFKRELAQICMDLSNAASNAANPVNMLPGTPLSLPQDYPPLEEGVSSMTITMVDGEVTMVYTNTLPCINAAGTTLHDATLAQYSQTAGNASAKAAYGRELSSIMSSNRLYNHALSEVCANLVRAAKRNAKAEQDKK